MLYATQHCSKYRQQQILCLPQTESKDVWVHKTLELHVNTHRYKIKPLKSIQNLAYAPGLMHQVLLIYRTSLVYSNVSTAFRLWSVVYLQVQLRRKIVDSLEFRIIPFTKANIFSQSLDRYVSPLVRTILMFSLWQ